MTPPYGRFWPLPDGGNWEGGTTDCDGIRWVHVPYEGWRVARPSPFLTSPRRQSWWARLRRRVMG